MDAVAGFCLMADGGHCDWLWRRYLSVRRPRTVTAPTSASRNIRTPATTPSVGTFACLRPTGGPNRRTGGPDKRGETSTIGLYFGGPLSPAKPNRQRALNLYLVGTVFAGFSGIGSGFFLRTIWGLFLRTFRKIIDIGLALTGVAVILAAVLYAKDDLRVQLVIVGAGMVILELGVWKAGHRILPSGRRYLALRAESDLFMRLVRQLNMAALAVKQTDSGAHTRAFEEVRGAMHESVERMAAVAGKTNAELAPALAGPSQQAPVKGHEPDRRMEAKGSV